MIDNFELLISGRQLRRLYEKKCEAIVKRYGLRKVEADIIYYLSNYGSCDTAKDIMQLEHLSKAHISQALEKLEKLQYVQRYQDEADKRWVHLVLTREAFPIAEEIFRLRQDIVSIIFRGVTDVERHYVLQAAIKMVANINRELQRQEESNLGN